MSSESEPEPDVDTRHVQFVKAFKEAKGLKDVPWQTFGFGFSLFMDMEALYFDGHCPKLPRYLVLQKHLNIMTCLA